MSPRPLGLHQHQGLRQELLLLPQMLQSLELLALPALELTEWLETQAQANTALEVRPPQFTPHTSGVGPENSPEPAERPECLLEHLADQLGCGECTSEQRRAVLWLATQLDERGWLVQSDEELLSAGARAGAWPQGAEGQLGLAIARLQQLEPRGIGARDLTDALLLQLDPRSRDYPRLARLIETQLGELSRGRRASVAQNMGIELAELDRLCLFLRGLDPFPARGFGVSSPPIHPELIVERDSSGSFEVRLDSRLWPSARIDPRVEALAREAGRSSELGRYLRPNIEAARSIQSALIHRQRTLARVGVALFARQARFLEDGPRALIPLSMQELADELSLSVSTISRAVAGKHAQTPWGIHPLRSFFPAALGVGEGKTKSGVVDAVRALFAAEDPRAPLSDDEALKRLQGSGYALARRTLAKYRSELGIPASYARRRP